ncbi:hypothetical protein E2C01_086648 [Portunus trituberculatus]|uniref:Uncharacterized protein n=1 Tax=Portunus trituberculatus TaxID=210409 RepID=A0A5B7J5Z3_PORTR|nr:hypothetical protein [Portunus trituberculatus]
MSPPPPPHSLHLRHHTFTSPTTSPHFCLDMISLPVTCTFANRSTFSMDVILTTNEVMRKDATTR